MIQLVILLFIHAIWVSHGVREHTGVTHHELKTILRGSYDQCTADDSCYANARSVASTTTISSRTSSSRVVINNVASSITYGSDTSSTSTSGFPCEDGYSAGIYPCSNIDMLSHVDLADLGIVNGTRGNDIWGWTDEATGHEYALAGLTDGTSFVNVTDPYNPFVIAVIDSFEQNEELEPIWRDIKVYKNFAYITCETSDEHGLQYVNLTQLIIEAIEYYEANGVYSEVDGESTRNLFHLTVDDSNNHRSTEVTYCHNLFINEDTGYVYTVGCNTAEGGITIFKIVLNNDTNVYEPILEATFDVDGYTHDIQCILFHGDSLSNIIATEYDENSAEIPTEIELCAAFNEDSLALIDVTYKDDIKLVHRMRTTFWNFMIDYTTDDYEVYNDTEYPYQSYTHQGWFDKTNNFIFMTDELDEWYVQHNSSDERYKELQFTRTYVINVTDVYNPTVVNGKPRTASYHAIDHNHYEHNGYLYQGNHRAGVRILNVNDVSDPLLPEVGYFDTWPSDDDAEFQGIWSLFPFFESGTIIAQDIEKGLFVLKLNEADTTDTTEDSGDTAVSVYDLSVVLKLSIAIMIIVTMQ